MPVTYAPPAYDLDFDPHWGEAVEVEPGLRRLTARNTGPGTFKGTNTYILGQGHVAVLDPGPPEPAHLDTLLAALAGETVEAILLSHTHFDHSGLAAALKSATGAPLLLAPGGSRADGGDGPASVAAVPDRPLADGDRIEVAGLGIEVVATPGHAADHLVFGLGGTDILLSGDHVMGWNSTIVAAPDGSLGDYIASLDRLDHLPYRRYLPGHGGAIEDGRGYARTLRTHRENRNLEIREAVEHGIGTLDDLFQALYSRVHPALAPAARRMLETQVLYLRDLGQLAVEPDGRLTAA